MTKKFIVMLFVATVGFNAYIDCVVQTAALCARKCKAANNGVYTDLVHMCIEECFKRSKGHCDLLLELLNERDDANVK